MGRKLLLEPWMLEKPEPMQRQMGQSPPRLQEGPGLRVQITTTAASTIPRNQTLSFLLDTQQTTT